MYHVCLLHCFGLPACAGPVSFKGIKIEGLSSREKILRNKNNYLKCRSCLPNLWAVTNRPNLIFFQIFNSLFDIHIIHCLLLRLLCNSRGIRICVVEGEIPDMKCKQSCLNIKKATYHALNWTCFPAQYHFLYTLSSVELFFTHTIK